jgi:hypothetical protein
VIRSPESTFVDLRALRLQGVDRAKAMEDRFLRLRRACGEPPRSERGMGHCRYFDAVGEHDVLVVF